MDKFLIVSRDGMKNGSLLEIIPSNDMAFTMNKKRKVIAEAESKNEAFVELKNIVEKFIIENPDCDFTKFREWSLG